jgi:hypothetical protein
MIRRVLLLKFVSWCVLAPVLALAPTQPRRFVSEPRFVQNLVKPPARPNSRQPYDSMGRINIKTMSYFPPPNLLG